MDLLFKPSLKRRLVLTLLIGMLLIWGMLLAKDYLGYKHKLLSQLEQGQLNQSLLTSLERLEPYQAESAIAHTHTTFEQLTAGSDAASKGPVYFQWQHLSTGRQFLSHPAVSLPATTSSHGQIMLVDQRPYWPVTKTSAHWQLTIWHPAMDDAAALTAIGLDLLGYMLWAFPVLVLLLMLAVWQGLKPLKRLADDVKTRGANDFAALRDPTGYLELKPILVSFNDLLGRVRLQREHEKQFYETVAHELKTPLAIVAGHAHVVATTHDPEIKSQSLLVLEKTIETTSTQINQLICLSSLSSQLAEPCPEVDVVRVAQDLMIDFMPLAQKRRIELMLDAPEHLLVPVSEPALALVLKNLLKNAITHGSEQGRVAVRISQSARNWTLVVADDGPGLSEEQWARRGIDPRRAHEGVKLGSGLGLTIVAQAAEILNGQLTWGAGLDGRGLSVSLAITRSECR